MADFNQLLKILNRETPARPVLFELFMCDSIYRHAIGEKFDASTPYQFLLSCAHAFDALGYDYVTAWGPMDFPKKDQVHLDTISLNDGAVITDRMSFDRYQWPDADTLDYSKFDQIKGELPKNMKLMVLGPCGVLENVIALVGYEALSMMIFDDEQLVYDIFEQVGSRLVAYYKQTLTHESVGLVCANDDWGFNTQTMLSVADMRRFVFPWHKEIVKVSHAAGRPVVLHSCGNFTQILDDLFDIGYDARHSYEDNIIPVEKAYDVLSNHLAVFGGIDVDFLIRESEEAIEERVKMLLLKTGGKGYAVGSGNSIPNYIPVEKYFRMINTAKNFKF